MNKPTMTQLAAYGRNLQIYTPDVTVTIGSYNFEKELIHPSKKFMLDDECFSIDEVTPLLRPMKNLDKPIVVDGYNEGKEFVPSEVILSVYPYLDKVYYLSYSDGHIRFSAIDKHHKYPKRMISLHSLTYSDIDLLNIWQFDYRGWIDAGYAKELKD